MQDKGQGVAVREATDDDVAAFAEFFREAWREAGPDAPGFAGASDEVIEELTAPAAVRARIGGPEQRMFLAWRGTEVVGFAATRRIDADAVELAGIIVLERSAGGGVGSVLVEAATTAAAGENYLEMIVRTETTNERARAFYESRGFSITGTATEQVEGSSVEVCELARELV